MIKYFSFNHFEVNCYLIIDEQTRECVIVDPSPEASFEDEKLAKYIADEYLQPVLVLLTHAHVDHIAGLKQVCIRYNLPVTMHKDGRKLLAQAEGYGSVMGFAVENMHNLDVVEIDDGDHLKVGTISIDCRFVPGHCPGSMCYVVENDKAVLTGDALFHLSIGRTDLPGGDYETLIENLRARILTLPDDYKVMPGHGIESEIWKEKKFNSFLK